MYIIIMKLQLVAGAFTSSTYLWIYISKHIALL